MTSFLQAVSCHTQAGLPRLAAFTGQADAAQRDDAEYQAVFAITAALLAGGVAIVLTALSHAL